MDLLIAAALLAGTFIVGITGNLLANELYDSAPSLARRLVRFAASQLPNWKRARYEEEWLADLNERDGKLGKTIHAVGCLWASVSLKNSSSRRSRFEKFSTTVAYSASYTMMRCNRKTYIAYCKLFVATLNFNRFKGIQAPYRSMILTDLVGRLQLRLTEHSMIKRLIKLSQNK